MCIRDRGSTTLRGVSLVQLRSSKTGPARDLHAFLPMTREEMDARGWDELDVLIINGDAYVDHPAFGGALIGRFLAGRGLRVGMVAQPRWDGIEDLLKLGRPRLMVGITAGNLDSMLNKLTAQKKLRSEDQYSPGGRTGCRPDRATLVYAQRCREAFGDEEIGERLGGGGIGRAGAHLDDLGHQTSVRWKFWKDLDAVGPRWP